jgi:RHS repeat-associated protein
MPEYRYAGINVTLYANGEAVAINRYSTQNFTGGTAYLGKDVLGSVRGVSNEWGQLAERYEYDAFGKPYKGDLDSGMNLGYTGKPYDSATGMYNYGYRDYQPEVARFTTVDPIRDGANWFAYVNNDPVNWVDPWGLAPGDIFPTPTDAAADFGLGWNGISILNQEEWGTTIYENGGGFTYVEPETQHHTNDVEFPLPPGGEDYAVSAAHTHGNHILDSNNFFSKHDMDLSITKGKESYISTPDGSLKVFDPITGEPRTIREDMPSDPNDPNRKNQIDPTRNTPQNSSKSSTGCNS